MCQSKTFCATPKGDFYSVNLFFLLAQIFFEEALNAIKFLDWHKTFWDLVKGQGINPLLLYFFTKLFDFQDKSK